MAAVVSFRKQQLIFAASSCDSGGERRVFENPARGALIIMPIAHLSVTVGFRRPEVSISSFIVLQHGERIFVFLRRSAQFFSESACQRSLFPDPHWCGNNEYTMGSPFVDSPGWRRRTVSASQKWASGGWRRGANGESRDTRAQRRARTRFLIR